MATTSNKRSELLIVCNSQQAEQKMKAWRAELKQSKAAMQQLIDAGQTGSQRFLDLDAKIKNLTKTIHQNDVNLNRISRTLQDLSNASLRQVERAARDCKAAIRGMSENDPNLKVMQGNLQKLNLQIQKLKGTTTQAATGMSAAWNKTAKAVASYMGVTFVLGKVKSMLTDVFDLNLKFSDQMANIRKVSGLAYSDISRLTNNLAKIDTRTSIEELNNIAYAGAKLGIGKWGTEALQGFVTAANQVNVALKEDMGEEALTALSKMTEVMGLIDKMGVEKSMLATGSAIFQLGATSTANATNIVEFSKRLMGMAQTAGITTDQLLALGSSADSMGLMPEVAATAFNRFISSLQSKHNLIEKDLGIAPGTINNLYSAGKAIEAIVLIFERMKATGNMNAMQGIFKDLGSEGARLTNVMVTMSRKVDMLKEHLYTAQEAFEDGMAVTNEYNIQQETAAALMERARNAWAKAFVNSEGVDSVKQVAQAWYDLSESLSTSAVYMSMAKGAMGALFVVIRALLTALPLLVNFMLMRGAYAAISMVGSAMTQVVSAIRAAITVQVAFNAASRANVFAAIASVVLTAVSAIWAYADGVVAVGEAQKGLKDYLAEANTEFERETRKIKNFVSVANDVNTSMELRQKTIAKFNQEYRPYLTRLGLEVKNATQLTNAYKQVNDELKKKIYYQMRDRAYDGVLGTFMESQSKALINYADIVNNRLPDMKAYTTAWLQEQIKAGKGTNAIFTRMMQGTYGKDNVFFDQKTQAVWQKGKFGGSNMRNLSNVHSSLFQSIDAAIKSGRAYNANKAVIDKAFDPIIGDYVPWQDENIGTLEKEAPDKDAALQAKRDANDRKRMQREDLNAAQDEAKAIISNIQNFYQRQITQILRTANENNWDESLLQASLDAVNARQNLALMNARKGISGISVEWEDFKTSMKNDMLEMADEDGYNQSQTLLDSITSNNLAALHDKIAGLERDLKLPQNAAIDAIWRNATLNEKANETTEHKRQKERNAKLLQDNYTGQVDKQYSDSMTKLGFFSLDKGQSDNLLAGGKDADILLKKREADIKRVFSVTRDNMEALLDMEAEMGTEAGKHSLLTLLFGEDYEKADTELKAVLTTSEENMRVFYNELIKYSDDYTEALKRAHERQKKILDFKWQRTDNYKTNSLAQKRMQMAASGVAQFDQGVQGGEQLPYKDSYGTKAFISSMGTDPEVLSYELKMRAAQEYYDFLKAHAADAETLRTAEQSILTAEMDYAKSVREHIKQQMDDIYSLMSPVEQFGTAMGEAFAAMGDDSKSSSEMVREAIGDMIKSFMKQTMEMAAEYAKRRIMQKVNDRLTSKAMKLQAKDEKKVTEDKGSDVTDALKDAAKDSLKVKVKMGKQQLKEEKIISTKSLDQQEAIQDASLASTEMAGQAEQALSVDAASAIATAENTIQQEALVTKQTTDQAEVQSEAAKTSANTTMGIASGASKIIGSLGWWGIPLVAVITALLNGLLSMAMSKVTSLFGGGGGDAGADAGPAVKLVSGMLTYDAGNVQSFRGVIDGKTYPVVGSDGRVYAASDGGELSTGLVSDPITTFVNGQPALVAERGPEMVIGRETTAAMMMARPDILAEIVKFDRNRSGMNYRAFDAGNVAQFAITDGSAAQNEELNNLRNTVNNLAAVLSALQRNGIPAHINMYGRGSVTDSAKRGADFMQRNSGDALWRKRKP